MKILKLEIDNLKRITALEIDAKGEPIALSGDNGAGKSSVIDAIVWALTGQELVDPIRHGAASGEARLTVGDPDGPILKIVRTASRKGEYLKVYGSDDKTVASPQKFIDALIRGRLALDPMEFLRMKPKDQAVALRLALGLTGKTSEIDERRKALFDERTEVNRERERARAKLQPYDISDAGLEPTSVGILMQDLQAAEDLQRRHDQNEGMQRVHREKREILEKKVAELNTEIAMHSEQVTVLQFQANAFEARPTKDQVDQIRNFIADNDQRNTAIRHAKEMAVIEREALDGDTRAGKLTLSIDECDQEKADLLAEVKMPYPGMEITDDGVYIKGETLEQQSTGEQIKISCMIAMAAQPDLRLLIIREGALINERNRAMIYSIAESRKWQVWEERFSEKPMKDTLHIVQGRIEEAVAE